MTDSEFTLGLLGDPKFTKDGMNRVRYIVADAISAKAGERRKEGRPDKAGVLAYAASQIRSGRPPSKKSMSKIGKDITEVRQSLVDGKAA